MCDRLAPTNLCRNHRTPPAQAPASTTTSTDHPTGWRNQLAALYTWLSDIFTPLRCSKRSAKHLTATTTATQTEPMQPLVATDPVITTAPFPSSTIAPTPAIVRDKVHAYVDAWYEANHDGVDIGRIDLPLIGEVDVFPDEREKALYRKVFTLALTNLLEIEVKVAGVPMRLSVVQEEEDAQFDGATRVGFEPGDPPPVDGTVANVAP